MKIVPLITSLLVLLAALAGSSHGQAIDVHLTDITRVPGSSSEHVSSPEKKYIVESMSGGVALFDYDNDGYLDLYLVNSLTVDLVKSKQEDS